MATSLVSPAQPGTRGPGRAATAAKGLAPGRPWAPTQKPVLLDPDISGVPLAFPQAAGTGGRGLRAQDTLILAPPLRIKKWVRLSRSPGHGLDGRWGWAVSHTLADLEDSNAFPGVQGLCRGAGGCRLGEAAVEHSNTALETPISKLISPFPEPAASSILLN